MHGQNHHDVAPHTFAHSRCFSRSSFQPRLLVWRLNGHRYSSTIETGRLAGTDRSRGCSPVAFPSHGFCVAEVGSHRGLRVPGDHAVILPRIIGFVGVAHRLYSLFGLSMRSFEHLRPRYRKSAYIKAGWRTRRLSFNKKLGLVVGMQCVQEILMVASFGRTV